MAARDSVEVMTAVFLMLDEVSQNYTARYDFHVQPMPSNASILRT